jgi:hypothetical protein
MDAANATPSVVAVEVAAGYGGGGQTTDSQSKAHDFSDWSGPAAIAGGDMALPRPFRFGLSTRYEYLRFTGSINNKPRAHLVQIGAYFSVAWCEPCEFSHGPRLGAHGYEGFVSVQGPQSDQGGYTGYGLSLEYVMAARVASRWSVTLGAGLSMGNQDGFGVTTAVVRLFVTTGIRFDLVRASDRSEK